MCASVYLYIDSVHIRVRGNFKQIQSLRFVFEDRQKIELQS